MRVHGSYRCCHHHEELGTQCWRENKERKGRCGPYPEPFETLVHMHDAGLLQFVCAGSALCASSPCVSALRAVAGTVRRACSYFSPFPSPWPTRDCAMPGSLPRRLKNEALYLEVRNKSKCCEDEKGCLVDVLWQYLITNHVPKAVRPCLSLAPSHALHISFQTRRRGTGLSLPSEMALRFLFPHCLQPPDYVVCVSFHAGAH